MVRALGLLLLVAACAPEPPRTCVIRGETSLGSAQTSAVAARSEADGPLGVGVTRRTSLSGDDGTWFDWYEGPVTPRACPTVAQSVELGASILEERVVVANAGPLGVGLADRLLIGNPSAANGSQALAGEVLSVALPLTTPDSVVLAVDRFLWASSASRFGAVLVRAPDLDGDALDDIVAPIDELSSSGVGALSALYIIPGGASPPEPVPLLTVGRVPGQEAGTAGQAVALAAGDLDGDGAGDLVLTARDPTVAADPDAETVDLQVQLYLGPLDVGAPVHATLVPPRGLQTADLEAQLFGTALVIGGQWVGDDTPDVAVGTPAGVYLGSEANDTGWVAVYDGARLLRGGAVRPVCHWVGTGNGDGFGTTLAAVPDSDGDGVDELVVAAPRAVRRGEKLGAVFRFSGCTHDGQGDADQATATLWGRREGDRMGDNVISLGDLDDDGTGDFAVLASETERPRSIAGPGRWVIVFGE
ncbi:MAG: hypothetical protein ACI8PZ_000483 [Myxococcota bacterium]